MKRVSLLRSPIALSVAAAAFVSGCATQGSVEEIAAAKAAIAKTGSSIYFDFDKFNIRPEGQPTAKAYANYMKTDLKPKLVIEGNADERGTTEYNLALGQKRAEAVRKELESQGVSAGRIEAVSNGEEKPKAKGSTPAAWAENRRADLILK